MFLISRTAELEYEPEPEGFSAVVLVHATVSETGLSPSGWPANLRVTNANFFLTK